MSGVRVRNLRKSFAAVGVLDGVTFDVREGEFCILLGPSGCGKTTLLRILAGLEGHDGGEVWIGDREVSQLTPAERDVAMVFQSYALYPHMTVYENLAFPLKARRTSKAEIRKKIEEAARLLELQDLLGRRPRELSGGQRQRVAIGRAIVRTPAVFLFDEPLSNLDAKLRSAMRVELAKLHRRLGATMVYVTHDQVEAMTLGQTVVLLHEGTVQQVGTPRDLYERPTNLFVASFVGTPAMNVLEGALRSGAGGLVFEAPGVRLSLGERKDLDAHLEQSVHLGIRPEALAPVSGEGE
ncbi:MAG: ATP-binding cassette domain-containing protein, partial [Thermodesulfobacteriota bacterium]